VKKIPGKMKRFRMLSYDVDVSVCGDSYSSWLNGKRVRAAPNSSLDFDQKLHIERDIALEAARMLNTSMRHLNDSTTILVDIGKRMPAKYLSLRFKIFLEGAKLVNATP